MSQCLFTVTCNRDRWSFLQQYYSVNKYLESCTWYVVINELDVSKWMEWFKSNKAVSPHKIIFIPLSKYLSPLHSEVQDYIKSLSGYWRQLYLKLLIHLHCKEDRIVVLDSKNWLTKHCKLTEFPQQRLKRKEDTVFYGTIDFFEKYWNIETPLVTNNITPYIFYKKTLNQMWKEFDGENTGIMFLKNQDFESIEPTHQSAFLAEFFMYDIFCHYKKLHVNIKRDVEINSNYEWFDPSRFENKDKFMEDFKNTISKNNSICITIKWYVKEEGGALTREQREQLINIVMNDGDK